MAGFEIQSGLRTPLNMGLAAGSTALGLMARALEPVANRLMLPPGGQAEFVQELEEEGILEQIEANADLVRNNRDCGIPAVVEYGYMQVGEGVLRASASDIVPQRTVLKAAEVAVGIRLSPRRLPLTQEGVAQLDHLMDTARKVFFLPAAR